MLPGAAERAGPGDAACHPAGNLLRVKELRWSVRLRAGEIEQGYAHGICYDVSGVPFRLAGNLILEKELDMAATIGLVLDCADPDALARFWSAALGYTTIGSAGSYVRLVDPEGVKPKLLLQAVPEAKSAKNRMHLDIDTPDVEREIVRLESLGAHRLEREARFEHGTNWVIMADPEGNEFCVCDGGANT